MFCRRARSWISLGLDGLLPPDRTVALTEHLERCVACREHREQLQLGHRLLAVTRPRLADNFEWRLQLKLNQTLRESARAATLPWQQPERARGRWWGAAGLAAAAGIVAIIGIGRVLLPVTPGTQAGAPTLSASARTAPSVALRQVEPAASLSQPTGAAALVQSGQPASTLPRDNPRVRDTADDDSRTSFSDPLRGGSLRQEDTGAFGRPVSLWNQRAAASGLLARDVAWSGRSLDDLRTIYRLRDENQRLRFALTAAHRDNSLLKAQLDSTNVPPQDH